MATSENTALIVLDTKIVSATKADQAIWILSEAKRELDDIVMHYSLLAVESDEDKVAAEKGIMEIRSRRKQWDSQRKEWGHPLDVAKKAMDSAVRDRLDGPAKDIEDALTRQVARYQRHIEEEERQRVEAARKAAAEAQAKIDAERRAAEEQARKEAEAKGEEFVPPPPSGIPEIVVRTEAPREIPKAEGISYRRVWNYEVEDIAQVPDAYTRRVIDDEAVRAAIKVATVVPPGEKLSQCNANIPGIRVYYEDRPVVGGR